MDESELTFRISGRLMPTAATEMIDVPTINIRDEERKQREIGGRMYEDRE